MSNSLAGSHGAHKSEQVRERNTFIGSEKLLPSIKILVPAISKFETVTMHGTDWKQLLL